MGGAIDALFAGSTRVVEAGGAWWRIRRVRSADLARYEVVELVGAAAVDEEVARLRAQYAATLAAADGASEAQAEADRQIREAQERAAIRRVERDPSLLGKWSHRTDAWVCAGVEAIGQAADDLAPVRLVLDEAHEDRAAGRVWVGRVDEDTRRTLMAAIEELCGSPSIAPFRGGSGDPATA